MTDDLNKATDTNLLGFIEPAIFGLFQLAGQILRTPFGFLFRTDRMWESIKYSERGVRCESTYAPPLTYLIVSLVSLLALFSAIFNLPQFTSGAHKNILFLSFIIDALKTLDLKKLLLILIPYLLAIGLYAWSINIAARQRLGFELSLALAAYFIGTCSFVFIGIGPIIAMPPFSAKAIDSYIPSWLLLLSVVSWGAILKCIHSYLHRLRRELEQSRMRVLVTWSLGTGLFFFLYALVLAWLAPLTFVLLDFPT